MAVATRHRDIAAADIVHPDPAVAAAIAAAVVDTVAALAADIVAAVAIAVAEVEVDTVVAPRVAARLPEGKHPATPYPDRFADVP